MKIVCLQENLKSALITASHSVASQPQLPILSNLLLETKKNKILISATNLSQGIILWVNAQIEKEGKITVPAKIISEFVNSLPAGKIQLTAEKEKLFLLSGKFKASLNGLSASEFPSLPTIEKIKAEKKKNISFQLPVKKFTQAISQTAFAAATDESRPVLTGVLWKIGKNEVNLVATDGYRLSIKKLSLELPEKIDINEFIIPAAVLQEVVKMGNDQEAIEMLLVPGGKQVIFDLTGVEIISQLLEGEYPDFAKIIPSEGETKVVLDREEFLQAVQIGAIFARESANIIKFKIGNGKLTLSANTPQVGDNESVLEAKITGPANKIAFNSRFVLDFLKSIASDEVEMIIANSTSPAIFKPLKKKTYQHIIMPVRVSSPSP